MRLERVWTLLDLAAPGQRMRRAWNRRARSDARHFIAGARAETEQQFWASGERDLSDLLLRDLLLAPDASALEIGCGIGRLLRPLAARVEKAWGVDISEEMVARARQALGDLRNVEILPTDGRLNGLGEATLDLVVSFIVFQHVPSKRSVSAYIGEANRVLKSGGVFRFQVDGRPRRRWSRSDTWRGVWYTAGELRRELAAAGFAPVELWGEGTQYLWATAVRADGPARPRSTAVRVRRRAWCRESLEALLLRLGAGAAVSVDADSVLRGERSLRASADPLLRRGRRQAPDAFVRRAYEAVLGRAPDPEALAFHRRRIGSRAARAHLIDCLMASPELEEGLRPRLEGPPSSMRS